MFQEGPLPATFDEVGPWTEVKFDILSDYAPAYSTILASRGFHHLYIDAFAAGGAHLSRKTGQIVPGSPLIALATEPPFREYHFIDANPARVDQLRAFAAGRPNVYIYTGDCNTVLLRDVFPQVRYEARRRALCLLDPYNIDVAWEVVSAAAKTRSIEIFLNFMIMDMNMNVLLRDPAKAALGDIGRMNRFWGDDSWRSVAYEISPQGALFGDPEQIKVDDANDKIADAYRARLCDVGGFAYAPRPLRFVNSLGRTIYYLFFASPNATGKKIVEQIFEKYRRKQGV
jgi:three-Cys-motif partner protein